MPASGHCVRPLSRSKLPQPGKGAAASTVAVWVLPREASNRVREGTCPPFGRLKVKSCGAPNLTRQCGGGWGFRVSRL